jgi:hypothetical protein
LGSFFLPSGKQFVWQYAACRRFGGSRSHLWWLWAWCLLGQEEFICCWVYYRFCCTAQSDSSVKSMASSWL